MCMAFIRQYGDNRTMSFWCNYMMSIISIIRSISRISGFVQLFIFWTVFCCWSGLIRECYALTQLARPEFLAVDGELATLPCNLSSPLEEDAASLILWYREDLPNPLYTLDLRKGLRHFPSARMEGRAYFDLETHPPLLKVYPIHRSDQGDYKCRVDLRRSRTYLHYTRLTILVPPQVVIKDDQGQTLHDVIGPFDEGTSLTLICEATEGEPPPIVTWWKGNALLDDSYNQTSERVVQNQVLISDLHRSDLLIEVICQASNTNLTKPRTAIVMLDLNLRPLEVKVLPRRRSFSVGWVAQLTCEARGARPQASLTWWREGEAVQGTTETVLEDGNLTLSTFAFNPRPEDNGRNVMCRASHPTLQMTPIEDTISLQIHYAPQLVVVLGTTRRPIQEGSDVYFECNIRANPPVSEVTWYVDDVPVTSNVTRGISVNNQSLILQRIGRTDRGTYKCTASNTEGEGHSDQVKLEIQYSPVCLVSEAVTLSVVSGSEVRLSCEVEADPHPTAFQWTLNSTVRGTMDLRRKSSNGHLTYTPTYLEDYGDILCWAKNAAGVQRIPCVHHLIPEGEVPTDVSVLIPPPEEEDDDDAEWAGAAGGRGSSPPDVTPAVGVLAGVGAALLLIILIIVIVMRMQTAPPTRRTYFEEEKFKYPSPIKKDSNDSLVDGNEKSPDIIPLPSDIDVYATSVAVEMCSTSLSKQSAEVYFTVESQTCV